jgi:hypothetical protein
VTRGSFRCAVGLALGATLGSVARDARASDPDTARCISAHEQSQILRRAGRLRAARAELVVCAHPACPEAASVPCHRWLGEVDASTPSVVVGARDRSGQAVVDVRVECDGTLLVQGLDGRSVPVDPGRHLFRFVASGSAPVEREIVILEGEKNRRLDVAFGGGAAAQAPAKAARESATTSGPRGERTTNPLVYVFGAVGIAGVAAFAVLAGSGLAMESELRDSGCSPNCSRDEISDIKTRYLVGDVALGVGVVALGAAAWFLFSRSSRPSAPAGGSNAFVSTWQARRAGAGAAPGFTTSF